MLLGVVVCLYLLDDVACAGEVVLHALLACMDHMDGEQQGLAVVAGATLGLLYQCCLAARWGFCFCSIKLLKLYKGC